MPDATAQEPQRMLFAMVDGGLHHHLANSGNFGQGLRKNYPVVIANKLDRARDTQVKMVGPRVHTARHRRRPDPAARRRNRRPGGRAAVGAYGYTASRTSS